MSIGKILLTWLLIPVCILGWSQVSDQWHQQEYKVQAGLRAMYNTEYTKALEIFQEVINSKPFHPMGPLGYLAVRWHLNDINLDYQVRNEEFLKDIDKMLAIYKNYLQQDPDNPQYTFFYGTVLGLKARVQLGEKDYLGVLWSAYKAIRLIKAVEKRYPQHPDFNLPSAVFSYYVGISAPYMQIASWILNISGSKEEGLKGIKNCADNGNYGRYEAQSLLAYIYFYFEGDFKAALAYAEGLSREFPRNVYYKSLTANLLLLLGRNEEAIKYLKEIKKALPTLTARQQQEYGLRLHLYEGLLGLNRGDLVTAEQELNYFIRNYNFELDYELANALLQLAKVYEQQGKREAAIDCYKRVLSLNNRGFASQQAEKILKK